MDVLLQAVFLYLQDKVVEKPALENGLHNPGFGIIIFHTAGREPLAMFLRAPGLSQWINYERLQLHIARSIGTKQELAYHLLHYSLASAFPAY